MKVLYRDPSILITDEDITINAYYFPLGQAKKIRWPEIRSVSVEPLTTLNGKYRVWGMAGIKPYWFHGDWRLRKKQMLVINTGHFIKAAITPDDFAAAKKAIETKIKVKS